MGRSVVIPEKNGGACLGKDMEFVECSEECNDEDGKDVTESNLNIDNNDEEIVVETVTESANMKGENAGEELAILNEEKEDPNNDVETVTKIASEEFEQTTRIEGIVEEPVTMLVNDSNEKNKETDTEQTGDNEDEMVTKPMDEDIFMDGSGVTIINEETTESQNNIGETNTDMLSENGESIEETTVAINEEDDSFGRKIPTETADPAKEITTTLMVSPDSETTTESIGDNSEVMESLEPELELDISETETTTKISDETEPELSIDIQDAVENRSQSESTTMNEEDVNSDDNEDNKIVFPLSEDVEIVTTTRAPAENSDSEETSFTDIPERTSMNTGANEETNGSAQMPDTSVAVVKEENEEDPDELTTISYGTESATESKYSEENEK